MSDLRVALTFDAEHPSRSGNRLDAPDRILSALNRAGVRATFFLQGRWASAYPLVARRIALEGHVIGNHSNYHAPLTFLSEDGIRADVRRAEQRIGEATGADPRPWFRCPFGDGADRPDVQASLDGLGYRDVPWTVDPGDWRDSATPGEVAQSVVKEAVSAHGVIVVLLHTWAESTHAALASLLGSLGAEGASFVTAEEIPDAA